MDSWSDTWAAPHRAALSLAPRSVVVGCPCPGLLTCKTAADALRMPWVSKHMYDIEVRSSAGGS
eukprot:15462438-Alexandrium_andersonii.AAC.1